MQFINVYRKNLPWLLLIPVFAIVGLLGIYPLIYSAKMSLFGTTLYSDRGFIGLENYAKILIDPDFHNSLLITFAFIGSATTIELAWGLGLAMVLNRLSSRIESTIRALIVLPLMITPITVASIWRLIYYSEGGVINIILTILGLENQTWLGRVDRALLAIIIAEVWQFTPFATLILFGGRKTIPIELYEAADIDGASSVQMFRHITFMMLRPLLMLCVIFSVMRQFKTFALVFGLTKGGPGQSTQLISHYLHMNAFRFYKISEAATLSLLVLFLLIPLGIVFIRYLRKF